MFLGLGTNIFQVNSDIWLSVLPFVYRLVKGKSFFFSMTFHFHSLATRDNNTCWIWVPSRKTVTNAAAQVSHSELNATQQNVVTSIEMWQSPLLLMSPQDNIR